MPQSRKKEQVKQPVRDINHNTMCPGAVWIVRTGSKILRSKTRIIQYKTVINSARYQGVNSTVWYSTNLSGTLLANKTSNEWLSQGYQNSEFSHIDRDLLKYFKPDNQQYNNYPQWNQTNAQNLPPHLPPIGSVWCDQTGRQLEIESWTRPLQYPQYNYWAICKVLNPQYNQRHHTQLLLDNFDNNRIVRLDHTLENQAQTEEDSDFVLKL